MFKISFYVRRKKEVLANDFREYWLGEHAQIQKQYLEGVRRTQLHKMRGLAE